MMNKVTANNSPATRLITIAVSHYCEKARWALDWLKIPYIEESHAPLFHRLATRKYGGKSVPILVNEVGNFIDSTDILHHLDTITENRQLYPTDPKLRREVDELEDLFDTQLGVYTRCWAYSYTLNDRKRAQQRWGVGTPWIEQVGLVVAFPLMCRIVQQAYNTTAEGAANSLQGIRRIFETVSGQLADGRSYLVGNSFSAADLTFAALSAPVLLPSEHPLTPPQLDQLPDKIAKVIQELRETPAGAYALRLYREQRSSSVSTSTDN